MNTKIEIHNNSTNTHGNYSVWYKDLKNNLQTRILSESVTDGLLTLRQKELFADGKFKFKISESDFESIILNGEIPKHFK